MDKKKVSFTLSADCMKLLKGLAEKKGVSMTAIIELMVRDEAKRLKL